jgi:hypothetical protein
MTLLDWIRVAAEAELAVSFRRHPKTKLLTVTVHDPHAAGGRAHEHVMPSPQDYWRFGVAEADSRAGKMIRESIAYFNPQAIHGRQLGPHDYHI